MSTVGTASRFLTVLRTVVALFATVGISVVVLALSATPVRAVILLAAGALVVGAAVMAYRALGRRERWAFEYAVAILVIAVGFGMWLFLSPPSGPVPIPAGSIVAGMVLLWLLWRWDTVRPEFTGPTRHGRVASVALLAALAVPTVVPGTVMSMTDPTQVSAGDLSVQLAVACAPSSPDPSSLAVTANATITWAQRDLLPNGLLRAFESSLAGDVVLVAAVWDGGRPADPNTAEGWSLSESPASEPWLANGYAGPPAGATVSLAGGPPDEGAFEQFHDQASIGLPQSPIVERMTLGVPYQATWVFTQREPFPWPAVRIRYVHEYRFAVEAMARCGETVAAQPAG